jgi:hypothetical protein
VLHRVDAEPLGSKACEPVAIRGARVGQGEELDVVIGGQATKQLVHPDPAPVIRGKRDDRGEHEDPHPEESARASGS